MECMCGKQIQKFYIESFFNCHMVNNYYVDSCVYLNLWQKEKSKLGKPLWKLSKNFFEKAEQTESLIYYSGFLLKELSFILTKNEFAQKRLMFEASPNFKKMKLTLNEYKLARKIESKNKSIGFYDILHMLLTKKTNSTLITRDRKLLKLAKKYKINAKRPEEIL